MCVQFSAYRCNIMFSYKYFVLKPIFNVLFIRTLFKAMYLLTTFNSDEYLNFGLFLKDKLADQKVLQHNEQQNGICYENRLPTCLPQNRRLNTYGIKCSLSIISRN